MKKFILVLLMLILAFAFLMSPAFAAEPERGLSRIDMSASIVPDLASIVISGLIMAEAADLLEYKSMRVGNLQPLFTYMIFFDKFILVEAMSAISWSEYLETRTSGGMSGQIMINAKDIADRDLINVSVNGKEVGLFLGIG